MSYNYLDFYKADCKSFAHDTAGWDSLLPWKQYLTAGVTSGWEEVTDGFPGGVSVKWAFHCSDDYIDEHAEQKLLDILLGDLQESFINSDFSVLKAEDFNYDCEQQKIFINGNDAQALYVDVVRGTYKFSAGGGSRYVWNDEFDIGDEGSLIEFVKNHLGNYKKIENINSPITENDAKKTPKPKLVPKVKDPKTKTNNLSR